jgi:hypothetical protein
MAITRRKALLGVGSLVAGAGAIAGSGAFTGASAERTVSVEFADDSAAYLGIGPIPGDDREAVSVTDDGAGIVQISVTEVSASARTVVGDLVQFTNNSPRAIERLTVTVEDESRNAALSVTGVPDGIQPGDTVTGLGLVIDTRDYSGQPALDATISIRSVLAPEEGS